MARRIETASCFCGAVTAELHDDPFWICYDHDGDCRKAIGGPMALWVGYRPNEQKFTSGSPKSYSKTAGAIRTFCGDCGTSISYADEGLADEVFVTIGFLDHPERFAPLAHAYWGEKLPFLDFADELPRIGGCSRERDPALGNPNGR